MITLIEKLCETNVCMWVKVRQVCPLACLLLPHSNSAQIFRTHFGRKQLNRKTHFKANNFSKSLPLNDFEIYFKQTKAQAHRSNSNTHRRTNSVLRKPEYAARKFIMLKNQSEKEVCVILFSFEMDFWPIWKFDDVWPTVLKSNLRLPYLTYRMFLLLTSLTRTIISTTINSICHWPKISVIRFMCTKFK